MATVEHGSSSTQYAWLRTRFSIERTLMAWGRTATALIGFGFTIGEFFSRFNDEATEASFIAPPRFLHLPLVLGLALIAVGTLGLAFACFEYWKVVQHLRSRTAESMSVSRPAAVYAHAHGMSRHRRGGDDHLLRRSAPPAVSSY